MLLYENFFRTYRSVKLYFPLNIFFDICIIEKKGEGETR